MSETQPAARPVEGGLDQPTEPHRTRMEQFWRLFQKNRMAVIGLVIFGVFFLTAMAGLVLTSGTEPAFDPAQIRLAEKLRPPFSSINREVLTPAEVPKPLAKAAPKPQASALEAKPKQVQMVSRCQGLTRSRPIRRRCGCRPTP